MAQTIRPSHTCTLPNSACSFGQLAFIGADIKFCNPNCIDMPILWHECLASAKSRRVFAAHSRHTKNPLRSIFQLYFPSHQQLTKKPPLNPLPGVLPFQIGDRHRWITQASSNKWLRSRREPTREPAKPPRSTPPIALQKSHLTANRLCFFELPSGGSSHDS